MKRSIFIVLLMALVIYVKAQDKKAEIRMSFKDYPIETLSLGDQGFVFRFADQKAGRGSNSRFLCYDLKTNLLWEKSVTAEYSVTTKNNGRMVVSPSGKTIYYIDFRELQLKRDIFVTRFLISGESTNYTLKPGKDWGSNILSIFCDDEGLYILSSEKGWETNKKKKSADVAILNVASGAKGTVKSYPLRLPVIDDPENSTFWWFLGQIDDDKYLISQHIDTKEHMVEANLVKLGDAGEIKSQLKLGGGLDDYYPRPSMELNHIGTKWLNFMDYDFNVFEKPMNANSMNYSPSSTMAYPWLNGAFGSWYFDDINGEIYSYGLLGQKPFREIGPVYNGYYVHKFDLEGNLKWKSIQTEHSEINEVAKFRNHLRPHERELGFRVLHDDTVNLSIYTFPNRYDFELNNKGTFKKVEVVERTQLNRRGMWMNSEFNYPSVNLTKDSDEKTSFTYYHSDEGETLVKISEKDLLMTLYYFGL
ncbi:hypothetical protein [Fulvivirga ligni]|uniref:hypothetical protein n=1 Tax=Fulvivirga ligni TaxID=2904246 RepID=UPI001F4880E2|nr:hypothetical protein [Fulvivirga ligni]UII21153.1 hypothetical protein LVD16_25280 [Fulvivirga ligni]